MPNQAENISWPGWEVVRQIGRGSFGAVYEIERQVRGHAEYAALKVISIPRDSGEVNALRADGYDDASIRNYFAESLERIENEYAIMAELKGSSNIVYCDDFRTVRHADGFGWDVYMKMELLNPMLSSFRGPGLERQVTRLGIDICNALVMCHKLNIIHRDIKPGNLFVSRDGSFKLGDFGIARTMEKTLGGTKTGTYDYMAPEVYNNQPYHLEADVYSLGLVMYWLLNDRTSPFLTPSTKMPTPSQKEAARARRFAGEPLPKPAFGSEGLKRIVLKACAYNPKDRFHSALEMKEALERLLYGGLAEEGSDTVTAGGSSGGGEPPRGKIALILGAAAAAVLLAAILWMSGVHLHQWTDSTCLAPETCSICGKTRGEEQDHRWLAADCESPEVCAVCGETRGSALGHDWTEAGCEVPKTCSVCGKTEGEPLGHHWAAATLSAPRTCLRCGAAEGKPLSPMKAAVLGAGRTHSVALSDGRVLIAGSSDEGQLNVRSWTDLIALTAGDRHTVGLKADGTVVAAGQNKWKQCDVSGWSDVETIAAGDYHTVALCANGALLATGWNTYGQCKVDELRALAGNRRITAIAAGYEHTVALCDDGTVAAIGRNDSGQCDVSSWTDIVAISAGTYHTVGLKSDGTVVAAGKNNEGQCNVSGWRDIVALCAGDYHTVGVRADGTVTAVGRNTAGQCDLNGWNNIILVAAGRDHTLGLRADGTVLAEGRDAERQCTLSGWSNLKLSE